MLVLTLKNDRDWLKFQINGQEVLIMAKRDSNGDQTTFVIDAPKEIDVKRVKGKRLTQKQNKGIIK